MPRVGMYTERVRQHFIAAFVGLLLCASNLGCDTQCLSNSLTDCYGGTEIIIHLGPAEDFSSEPAPWVFEVDVEGEVLRVECDGSWECYGSSGPGDADRGPWATVRDTSGDEDLFVLINAGYYYESIEDSVVSLLPRTVRVTVTDPLGVVRAQQWSYDPDHEGADVACTRCEGAREQVELVEMVGRPIEG